MPGSQDFGPDEISTDEVLRAGEAQLESSRQVLELMDDALRKGADIVGPRPRSGRDDDTLLADERRTRDRMSPQESWRY